ncbi:hypothetical protein ACFY93_01405 [Streptomyces sp. NPDC008313]|uniref:hypothetical protein n=1 Tax=Streptomyces sp. NPDC008313 TaxID=3364826 RepID=UPI0036EC81A5
MADEQYRWLDRETAERLLRGEPLEGVDARVREQAERLAGALDELAAVPSRTDAAVPGEAAALAAFRTARAGGDGAAKVSRRPVAALGAVGSPDAGLVRLGPVAGSGRGSRWGRPVRLGIAAAFAVGTIGSVAVAAGTGVLPTPFSDDRPGPAASVSAAGTADQPLVSPSPGVPGDAGGSSSAPDGTPDGSFADGLPGDRATEGATGSGKPSPDGSPYAGESRAWWNRVVTACRDLRDGRDVTTAGRRTLTDAAHGGKLTKYCDGVLAGGHGRTDAERDGREDRDDRSGDGRDDNDPGTGDHGGEGGGGDDDGRHLLPGDTTHLGNGGILTASPSRSALSAPGTTAGTRHHVVLATTGSAWLQSLPPVPAAA